MSKAVYLFVAEGFADWEPAHAVAELRRLGRFRVESVALTSEPVRSMGGLAILPSKTIGEVDVRDVAAFILPGGDRWERDAVEPELEALLNTRATGSSTSGRTCPVMRKRTVTSTRQPFAMRSS